MQYFLEPDALLPGPGRLLTGHALIVHKGRVQGIVPARGLPARARHLRFPGELWTAAPVLAHAHLESHDAPSGSWRRDSFTVWAESLLAWRERAGRLAPRSSALRSLHELADAGCGLVAAAVGEPGADGRAGDDRSEPPLLPEVTVFPEFFAPDPGAAAGLLESLDSSPPRPNTGLALHAPFSVSEELARGVFARARGWSVPVSIHLGEHEEERRFLAAGDGPLAELLRRRGRPGKGRRWKSPVDWLAAVGGLQPGTLAVHGGDLGVAELARLQAGGVAMVWCPGTHDYFGRAAPCHGAEGLPLPALGCDSRASNAALDPLRELRLARRILPGPGPQRWWEALTAGGARALGRPELGTLAAGSRARVLRLPWEPAPDAAAVCDRLSADPALRPAGVADAPFGGPGSLE